MPVHHATGRDLAAALTRQPDDPAQALALYERARRPRASEVVLAARARGATNHLASPPAVWRRDMGIAVRRRLSRDSSGRGTAWIAGYDASSPDVLADRF